jgi:hypothetical protein
MITLALSSSEEDDVKDEKLQVKVELINATDLQKQDSGISGIWEVYPDICQFQFGREERHQVHCRPSH